MRLIIRKEAERDIAEGFSWYEAQRRGLGSDFIVEVATTLSNIESEPMRFPRVHRELRRAQVRRFLYGAFFLAKPDSIVVVAVLHLARNPRRLRRS